MMVVLIVLMLTPIGYLDTQNIVLWNTYLRRGIMELVLTTLFVDFTFTFFRHVEELLDCGS